MRLNIRENLLYFVLKIIKKVDKRQTDLKYFNPDEVKNILVVSSTAIGDALMSTPTIRSIRKKYSKAKIIAHFNVKNMELFENNPDIHRIILYYGGWKNFFKSIKEFRKHKFDLALILHGNESQATPIAYLWGVGFIVKVHLPKKSAFLIINKGDGSENLWKNNGINLRLKTASFIDC